MIPVIRNIPYLRFPIFPKNFWGSQLPPPLEHPPRKNPVTTEKRSALFQGGFHSTGKILQLDTSLDPLHETYRRVYPLTKSRTLLCKYGVLFARIYMLHIQYVYFVLY